MEREHLTCWQGPGRTHLTTSGVTESVTWKPPSRPARVAQSDSTTQTNSKLSLSRGRPSNSRCRTVCE
jgi:hypothetical protein